MTTGRYNLISLGSIYFTKTGLSTGVPCKTEVTGLDALAVSHTGQTIIAIDGTPYVQTVAPIRGTPISILLSVMEESVYHSVRSAINTAVSGSTTLTLTLLNGAFGDYKLTVYPSFPQPITFKGDFQSGRVKDVTLNFTVSSVGYPLSVAPGALDLTGQSVTLTQG
jgi:hypothetical protein